MKKFFWQDLDDQRGSVSVYTALSLIAFLGVTALAVDVGHLYGVRNELHNAADAAALAGAHELFDNEGNLAIENAIGAADAVVKLNKSGNIVLNQTDNRDIEIGHWSFKRQEFTKVTSSSESEFDDISQVKWEERTFAELDEDEGFINAVQVFAKRLDTPSFFARILNIDQFFVQAKGVAYIGFAGSIPPQSVDMPFALCRQFLKQDDHYSCSVGRMISENSETGGWTNFHQDCLPSNPTTLKPLLCSTGNSTELYFGEAVSTNNGMDQTVFDKFYNDCWLVDKTTPPTTPLNMTIPVVDCASGGFSQPCKEKIVGVVNVDIIWVQRDKKDPAPRAMSAGGKNWTCDNSQTDAQCWSSFVEKFGLLDQNGSSPELDKKSIYFLPNCTPHEPVGTSGGVNYGILAEIPVLVQ